MTFAAFLAACGGGSDSGAGTGGQSSSAGAGGTPASAGTGGGGTSATAGAGGSQSGGAGVGGSTGGVLAAGMAGQGGSGGEPSGGGGAGGMGGGSGGTGSFPDPSTFVCNGMLGVSVNFDWFTAGFEDAVGSDKWQLRWRMQSFVEQWADPNNSVWSEPLVSACANGSTSPDRVLYTGVNWTYTTAAEWEPQLTAVVENIKTKYPGVKEIDLMTMIRAPNNMVCGDPQQPATKEQVTAPFVDEAIKNVAAKYPNLVRVAPPFYAPSCDVFQPNSPHYAAGGAAKVAKVFSDYYINH